jgi:3-isopropylmalate dehydrogenase
MLRHSFDLEDAARAVEQAVDAVLTAGLRTGDLCAAGETPATTGQIGDAIAAAIAGA